MLGCKKLPEIRSLPEYWETSNGNTSSRNMKYLCSCLGRRHTRFNTTCGSHAADPPLLMFLAAHHGRDVSPLLCCFFELLVNRSPAGPLGEPDRTSSCRRLLLTGDISSPENGSEAHTHAAAGPPALTAADMKRTVAAVWTCTVVLSLFLESCHAQKLNVHWGPQSMMYLKGKHGRRFVSEDEEGMMKHGLQGWYAVIRGIQRLQSLDFEDPRPMVSSEKVLIQYFRER